MPMDDVCQKISCWLPDAKRLHEGVYESVPMQECKDAGTNLSDLGGHRQVCGPRPPENSIETECEGTQDEEARLNSRIFTCFSVVLCNTTSSSCKGACLNHDVCCVVGYRETVEVESLRHQQSTFPRNGPETHICFSSSGRWTEIW